jgi:hypothetical protein
MTSKTLNVEGITQTNELEDYAIIGNGDTVGCSTSLHANTNGKAHSKLIFIVVGNAESFIIRRTTEDYSNTLFVVCNGSTHAAPRGTLAVMKCLNDLHVLCSTSQQMALLLLKSLYMCNEEPKVHSVAVGAGFRGQLQNEWLFTIALLAPFTVYHWYATTTELKIVDKEEATARRGALVHLFSSNKELQLLSFAAEKEDVIIVTSTELNLSTLQELVQGKTETPTSICRKITKVGLYSAEPFTCICFRAGNVEETDSFKLDIRSKALDELIQTEKAYVRDLGTVIKVKRSITST